jgi:hypothetical protein
MLQLQPFGSAFMHLQQMLEIRTIYYDALSNAVYDDNCASAYCMQHKINNLGIDIHTLLQVSLEEKV